MLGWLAFVVVAFALGGAAGTVTLKQADLGNGESRAANQVLAREFPAERAAEQVLIQSRSGPLRERVPRRRRGARGAPVAHRRGGAHRVAAAARQRGPALKDGTAALLTFQITGDPDTAKDRVAPALAATAAVQRPIPSLFVGEFGDASANQAIMSASSTTSSGPRSRRCR